MATSFQTTAFSPKKKQPTAPASDSTLGTTDAAARRLYETQPAQPQTNKYGRKW